MIAQKTIYGDCSIIDLMNYKNAFIVNIRHKDKNRQYYKEHKRRLQDKSFLAMQDKIKQYGNDFKEMFRYLEQNGFIKQER